MKTLKSSLMSKKHQNILDLINKRFVRCLITHKYMALKHLPDKEKLICLVFRNCAIMTYMIVKSPNARNKIFCMQEFLQKSKWMIFLDKLNSSNNNDQYTMTIYLFKILVQELILKEKDCKLFWKPAFKELSEKLLLPTEIDYVDLPSNLLNPSYKKQEVLSKYLTVTKTPLQKMNYHKTCYQSYISSIADKWEKGLIKRKSPTMKSLVIKIYPTKKQIEKINSFMDTYRFVYNRTLEYINEHGYEPDFQSLRNLLATERTKSNYSINKYYNMYINTLIENDSNKELINETKKNLLDELKKLPYVRNNLVHPFELETSNEIRSNAIKHVCDAYKTGFTNLKNGNIKYFQMKYKKKSNYQTIELATTDVKFCKTGFKICPSKFEKDDKIFLISKKSQKKYKNLIIEHNCDLVKTPNGYFIHIPIKCDSKINNNINCEELNWCGIDPGVRTLLSIYGNKDVSEINFEKTKLSKYNKKLDLMKEYRYRPIKKNQRNKYKKKQLYKIEKKKMNLINEIHWKTINYLIKTYDTIFFGDIKSHNIVKGNKNRILNRNMNDLKFCIFKNRLLYKCLINDKKIFYLNEAYTTQTCSSCGTLWKDIGSSSIYKCKNTNCDLECGRDYNSSKNIFMKGLLMV